MSTWVPINIMGLLSALLLILGLIGLIGCYDFGRADGGP
jgi:hypothetical protein